ncbi:unnamed protein product [Diatraea saccharalis]|uniref:Uncharacterized protein n=1 Tax=Diatraea saccharalis TaxID=40085 RepID=A0A9N9RCR0_9NEOP|nr:unnamed protein product [Diatraea saccharalis]
MDNSSEIKTEQDLISITKRDDDFYRNISDKFMENIGVDDQSIDGKEFNVITRSFNLTRRQWTDYYLSARYQEDYDFFADNTITEHRKKAMLVNNALQILMHSRYKIAGALKHRMEYRDDKRYRLGYLFNRMRRLMTEQRKVITLARSQNAIYETESLDSTVSLYERVVRLDVDIRDTTLMIKSEYGRYSEIDHTFPTRSPRGVRSPKPKTRKPTTVTTTVPAEPAEERL